MKIGNKIHKIRELKNISPKDMADRLNMSLSGYQRIERDEVSINMERLLELAGIFEMKPEDLLTFDEKLVFSNNTLHDHASIFNHGTIQAGLSEKLTQLYEDKIKLQAEMIALLQEKIKGLEGK
jgi:transcriptional regulator with XRE-family HTH domain